MTDSDHEPELDRGFYEYSVSDQMQTQLELYEEDRKKYHYEMAATMGEDAKETWKLVQQTAKAMIEGVGEIASFDKAPKSRILLEELLKRTESGAKDSTERLLGLLEEDVDICMGWEALHLMGQASDRFWSLLLFLAPIEPSWRGAEFLKRVSRCYLWGFDAECVVMCRSVLESELEAEVPREYCEEKFGERAGKYTLQEKILVAKEKRLLCDELARKADIVRELGNKAVHNWPKVKMDALLVISKTLLVMVALRKNKEQT